MDVAVTFSEAVTITGSPTLKLTVGSNERMATYISGDARNALASATKYFRYTIVAGDTDANGIAIPINALTPSNTDSIKDAAGNAATITSTAVPDNNDYIVDNTAPAFSSATAPAFPENTATATPVYTATATDSGTVTYSLKTGVGDQASFNINNSTGAVTFKASPNFEAKASYSFTVVATDAAGNTSAQAVSVNITDVNEDPVNTVPAGPLAAITATALTIGSIRVNDVDAGSNGVASVRLSVLHGTLGVSSTASGGLLAGSAISGSGTATLTLTGTQSAINATLATLSYTSSAGYSGADTLTVLTKDGGTPTALEASDPVTINVAGAGPDTTAPNPPTLALAADTGSSQTDGITNNRTVNVTFSEAGGTWEYSSNNGTNWRTGSGTSFDLDNYSSIYYVGNIQARHTDAAGNRSQPGSIPTMVRVDLSGPEISNTLTLALKHNTVAANTNLVAGDTIELTIQLRETASGLSGLPTGKATGVITIGSSAKSGTWSVDNSNLLLTYTVVAGDLGAITVDTAALKTALGSNIQDLAGNAPMLGGSAWSGGSFSAPTIPGYSVRTLPEISSFAVSDSDNSNGTNLGKGGEAVNVEVSFSEAVTLTAGKTYTVKVQVDSNANNFFNATFAPVTAPLASDHYTFSGTLPASSATGLSGNDLRITLLTVPSGASITGTASTVALTKTSYSTLSSTAYTVDTKAPTVAISTDKAVVKAGDTSTLTFAFSEDPGSSFDASDISATLGTVDTVSGTGLTRMAVFTPAIDTSSALSTISVAAGKFTDAAGNSNVASGNRTFTVDTKGPSITAAPTLTLTDSSTNAAPAANAKLRLGSKVVLTINLGEAANTLAGLPAAGAADNTIIQVNGIAQTASWSTSGSNLLLTYTVAAGNPSGAITVDAGALKTALGSNIKDSVGNPATIGNSVWASGSFTAPAAVSNQVSSAPLISQFAVSDTDGDPNFGKASAAVNVAVTFSEAVTLSASSTYTVAVKVGTTGDTTFNATLVTDSTAPPANTSYTFSGTLPTSNALNSSALQLSTLSMSAGASISANSQSLELMAYALTYNGYTVDNIVPLAPTLAMGAGAALYDVSLATATAAAGMVTVTGSSGSLVAVIFTDRDGHTVRKNLTGTGAAQTVALSASDIGTGTQQLSDGSVSVTAITFDAAGNVATAGTPTSIGSAVFILDTQAPNISNNATLALVNSSDVAVPGDFGLYKKAVLSVDLGEDARGLLLPSGYAQNVFTVGGVAQPAAWSVNGNKLLLTYTVATGDAGAIAVDAVAFKAALAGISDRAGNAATLGGVSWASGSLAVPGTSVVVRTPTPEFNIGSGLAIAENSTAVGTLGATDGIDGSAVAGLTWALADGGIDNNLFSLSSAGVLAFKTAPDFEGAHASSYSVRVVATSVSSGYQRVQRIAVNVTDANDAPTVKATAPAVFSFAKSKGTVSLNMADVFADVDAGDALTYSVKTGTLPGGLTLGSNGVLTGTPTATANPVSITFTATDRAGLTVDKAISIRVVDKPTIDRFAVFDSDPGELSKYGKQGDTVTLQVVLSEVVTATAGTLVASNITAGFTIVNGGTVASPTSTPLTNVAFQGMSTVAGRSVLTFTATLPAGNSPGSNIDSGKFIPNPSSKVTLSSLNLSNGLALTGSTSGVALSTQALGTPQDDYTLDNKAPVVDASLFRMSLKPDGVGGASGVRRQPIGSSGGTATFTFSVVDDIAQLNLTFTRMGSSLSTKEFLVGLSLPTFGVMTIGGVDVAATWDLLSTSVQKPNFALNHTIVAGEFGAIGVNIDKLNAVLSGLTDMAGNKVQVLPLVLESRTGERVDSQGPDIKIYGGTGGNTPISSPFTIAENSTDVTALAAEDPNIKGESQYANPDWKLAPGGTDNRYFSIEPGTGTATGTVVLRFKARPDYESPHGPSYAIRVSAKDFFGNRSTKDLVVNLTNVDEVAPVFTSASSAKPVAANSDAGQVVYRAKAIDLDFNAPATEKSITFSLKPGVGDASAFGIDSSTGAVTLTGNPNYGAQRSYRFTVLATDAANNVREQEVTLAVVPNPAGPAAPVMSNSTLSMAENATAAQTLTATTSATSGALTWSLENGGTDNSLFSLNPGTGALAFKTAPDYEGSHGNAYSVKVGITDAWGTQAVQDITVNVSNVNEAPTVKTTAPANVYFAQNKNTVTLAMTDVFADVDVGDTLTYTLTGTLPAGLNFANGVLGGTPTAASASSSITFTATDAGTNGANKLTASKTIAIKVASTPVVDSFKVFDTTGNPEYGKQGDKVTLEVTLSEEVTIAGTLGSNSITATATIGTGTTPAPTATTALASVGYKSHRTEGGRTVLVLEGTLPAGNSNTQPNNSSDVTLTGLTFSGVTLTGNTSQAAMTNLSALSLKDSYTLDNTAPVVQTTGALSWTMWSDGNTSINPNASGGILLPGGRIRLGVSIAVAPGNTELLDGLPTLANNVLKVGGTGVPGSWRWDSSGQQKYLYFEHTVAAGDGGLISYDETQLRAALAGISDLAGNALTVPQTLSYGAGSNTISVIVDAKGPAISTPASYSVAENEISVGTLAATDGVGGSCTWTLVDGGADNSLFSISSAGALIFKSAPDFEGPHGNTYVVKVGVSDARKNTTVQDITVTVTDALDAPSLFGVPQFPLLAETGVVTALADINVADSDHSNLFVTLSASNGTLGGIAEQAAVGGLTAHYSMANTQLTLSGPSSSINTALAQATFTASSDGVANIAVRVSSASLQDTSSATSSIASYAVLSRQALLDLDNTSPGNDATTTLTGVALAAFSAATAILPHAAAAPDFDVKQITLDFADSGNTAPQAGDHLSVGSKAGMFVDVNLNTATNTSDTGFSLGTLTGLDYRFNATTHLLTLTKTDGSAFTPANITTALTALQFMNATTTPGTRDFAVHLLDLAGNDVFANGHVVV